MCVHIKDVLLSKWVDSETRERNAKERADLREASLPKQPPGIARKSGRGGRCLKMIHF